MANYAQNDPPTVSDLVYIKTRNTGGKVEVHIASGASTYQTRVQEVATASILKTTVFGRWGIILMQPEFLTSFTSKQQTQVPKLSRFMSLRANKWG
jgi:hypothetical protein